ncbi:MAG: DUF6531 domain-containing protein, partial [Chloroflexota bacterium]|nr:DUF6531 domain-containing protein [Chloroflexota bacterium]
MASRGILGGYPCGGTGEPCGSGNSPYFRPNASATRGQIAKIASLVANLTDPIPLTQQTFQDVPAGSPFFIWIEQLAGRNVAGGYPCGGLGEPCVPPNNRPYFHPGGNTTRGQLAKIASNLFYPDCQPKVPGGPTTSELLGDENPGQETTAGSDGVGVNTATGNFSAAATDFLIPVRGPDLQLERTYNALAAATPGPFGFGWADSYHMHVDGVVNPVVHQENGSTLPFLGAGPNYTHDPRVLSELVRNSDGTYTLTRIHGQVRFFFNPQGKLIAIKDRNNHETRLAYNGNAQLQTVTDPAGRQLLFSYDADNHVTQVNDPAGNRQVTYGYNNGNLITAIDVGGHVTHYTYDTNHRLLTLTDPNGAVLQNMYNAQGRVIGQVGPLCLVYSFAYVTAGNHTTTTITDPRGIVSVHTHTSNRLTKVVEDAQGPHPATSTAAYGPGYVSGMTASTDPLGNIWYATWDARGNQLTRTDPLGHTTTYTYNATNDLLTRTDPLGHTTTYTYDANGNRLTTRRVLIETGQVLTTTYAYDPTHLGDMLSRTDPLGHVAHRTYDPVTGDLLTESNPLGETTSYQYDAIGRPLVITRPLGNQTTIVYNAYGDQLQVTDGLNGVTTYFYDGNRNRTAVQDANGHVTATTYDLANRRVRETRADGTHSDYTYDVAGNMVSQSNGLQQTTTYAYDAFKRRSRQTDPLNRTTYYNHDAAGRLLSVVDSASPPR